MVGINHFCLALLGLGASTVLADDEWAGCYKASKSCGFLGAHSCPEPKLLDVMKQENIDWALDTSCGFLSTYVNDNPDDLSTEWIVCIHSTYSQFSGIFSLKRNDPSLGAVPSKDECKVKMQKITSDCNSGAGGTYGAGGFTYRIDPNTGYCPEGVTKVHPPPPY
ncbi:hypothetical protein NM208_g8976 [Fusarium decemcellulare]|uniref:Uncharacterized protein n=1 Tax=Fusarium decemcellulare TaxID=57161 RepID=A0ACC1S394_9HYPO|nr:hypothetical protein NM208_g8976 [Fusarium decemcellulare]